jgi:uncharacterized protein (TIGR03067 family)
MRFLNFGVVILFLSAVGGVCSAVPQADPPKELAGKWLASEVEIEGRKVELAIMAAFDKQELTLTIKDKSQRYSISFPKPAEDGPLPIDLKILEGPNKGKTVLCIYELSSGSGGLRICGNISGNSGKKDSVRPKEFKTGKGDESALVSLTKSPKDK